MGRTTGKEMQDVPDPVVLPDVGDNSRTERACRIDGAAGVWDANDVRHEYGQADRDGSNRQLVSLDWRVGLKQHVRRLAHQASLKCHARGVNVRLMFFLASSSQL
eukprot:6200025-Pleurochrysis_carterae.AAC.3